MKTLIIALALMTTPAAAWQGIDTGFPGSGTLIREEPDNIFGQRTFSVTDDYTNHLGMTERRTTEFTCRRDLYGKEECSNNPLW